jgi:hypothetical protein
VVENRRPNAPAAEAVPVPYRGDDFSAALTLVWSGTPKTPQGDFNEEPTRSLFAQAVDEVPVTRRLAVDGAPRPWPTWCWPYGAIVVSTWLVELVGFFVIRHGLH